MNASEIESLFGGVSIKQIKKEYKNMSQEEILNALNFMWPEDDNEELAEAIYREIN
jgi:uncharacterized protein (DUF433 family)